CVARSAAGLRQRAYVTDQIEQEDSRSFAGDIVRGAFNLIKFLLRRLDTIKEFFRKCFRRGAIFRAGEYEHRAFEAGDAGEIYLRKLGPEHSDCALLAEFGRFDVGSA